MNWSDMLVGNASALLRTVVVGVLAYVALVVLLRASGKRTLSKFNAFDFIVTVALGSTLASVLTSQSVALLQGVTAFAVLLGLQFAITWLSVRSPKLHDLVKSEPALLVHRGRALHGTLRRERVTIEELQAAVREGGAGAIGDVEAAVLETDGTITVVLDTGEGRATAFASVRGHPAHEEGGDGRRAPRDDGA